jgi:hypothetical protein
MGQPNQEICSIRIMFPVESDEQAIEYKKKIAALLAEIPDAQIQFSLANIPASMVNQGGINPLR